MSYRIDNNTLKPVKNLGWLLKNWKAIYRFVVISNYGSIYDHDKGATMIAYNRDNEPVYITSWASLNQLIAWLHRPVFMGLPVLLYWFDAKSNKVWHKEQLC